jgi:arsenate reductase
MRGEKVVQNAGGTGRSQHFTGSAQPPLLFTIERNATLTLSDTGQQRDPLCSRSSSILENHMSAVVIYHNPKCSTSRKVLEMLGAAGITPQVIEYLKTPPERATLEHIIAATGEPVRALMRRRGTSYDEMDLDNSKWSDDQLIDLMLEQPVLINRPIVVTPLGARLCRPVEKLQEILP